MEINLTLLFSLTPPACSFRAPKLAVSTLTSSCVSLKRSLNAQSRAQSRARLWGAFPSVLGFSSPGGTDFFQNINRCPSPGLGYWVKEVINYQGVNKVWDLAPLRFLACPPRVSKAEAENSVPQEGSQASEELWKRSRTACLISSYCSLATSPWWFWSAGGAAVGAAFSAQGRRWRGECVRGIPKDARKWYTDNLCVKTLIYTDLAHTFVMFFMQEHRKHKIKQHLKHILHTQSITLLDKFPNPIWLQLLERP